MCETETEGDGWRGIGHVPLLELTWYVVAMMFEDYLSVPDADVEMLAACVLGWLWRARVLSAEYDFGSGVVEKNRRSEESHVKCSTKAGLQLLV